METGLALLKYAAWLPACAEADFARTGFIVAVFFGKDFDPDVDEIRPADHFGIEVIIEKKQAYTLQKEGVIPSWMVQDADKTESADTKDEKGGFEFDYSEKAAEDDEESSEEEGGRRKSNDDDVDVDDI